MRPINGDRLSTKSDTDQTLGRTGQQEATRPEGIEEDTVQNVRWSTNFDPHLFFSWALTPRPHFVTLCNCGGLPASTRTIKNANHTVGTYRSTQNVSTMAPPPWHAFRTGNGILNVPVELLQPQAGLYHWKGIFRSLPSTTECIPPSNRHSRAAKSQALFDHFRVFAGCERPRTTLGCFQLLARKEFNFAFQTTPIHVLKVLRALTNVATKRSATTESTVESVTFHTKTCNPGKMPRYPILGHLRFIKINIPPNWN